MLDAFSKFGPLDLAFLLVMTAQASAIAYLHAPRWKVLVFSLPLPFSFGSLALGQPIGVTHVAGVVLIPAFAHAITAMHYRLRIPIVPAIAVAALAYCAIGATLEPLLPDTNLAFGLAAAVAFTVGLILALLARHHDEPGHRSPLPVWIKLPIVAGIVLGLILSKKMLGGFMALFPIMNTITAYEARHSLRAVCRQVPNVTLAFVPMVILIRLLQVPLGLAGALPIGWAIFAAVLVPLSWRIWFPPTGEVVEPMPE